jgi:hypothetical protein
VNCGPPPASWARPRADVGAYYFDGWAGPLEGFHFAGLRDGPFSKRMPLYGWSDSSLSAMRRQLAWAHAYGVGFFVFDWYYRAFAATDPFVNHALENYESLHDHHGVGSGLLYVNTRGTSGDDNFVIPRSSWRATAEDWVTRHFVRRDYVRIDGRPVLFVLDSLALRRQLGGDTGVNSAFATLNRVARRHGLPGVFVVGGVYVGEDVDIGSLASRLAGEHYDAVTQYAYPAAPGGGPGMRPYSRLIAAARKIWDELAESSPVPVIPDVMAGWDPRPWRERVEGQLFWYRRTPALFGRFVRDAVKRASAEPAAVRRDPRNPLVLIEAWNELGEGSYIVPTAGTCHRYGRALARVLRAAGR